MPHNRTPPRVRSRNCWHWLSAKPNRSQRLIPRVSGALIFLLTLISLFVYRQMRSTPRRVAKGEPKGENFALGSRCTHCYFRPFVNHILTKPLRQTFGMVVGQATASLGRSATSVLHRDLRAALKSILAAALFRNSETENDPDVFTFGQCWNPDPTCG